MLDCYIAILRFPLALFATLFFILIIIVSLLIETLYAIFYLTILAIFSNKEKIKASWISFYPVSTKNALGGIFNMLFWVVQEDISLFSSLPEEVETMKETFYSIAFLIVVISLVISLIVWVRVNFS